MEVVKAFNNELSAMYECKPPISKAKMSQVTKAAIRGIKFYKHIVQSVEKFIQKCRPEYKVPGLYVIDSIVRQSRHQFGVDKDVFVPRFSKNMHITFQHLLRCPENDKPRIIKVLNLWQKNGVFSTETIQPLLDKANPDEATVLRVVGQEAASPPKQKDDPFWDSWQSSGHQSEIAPPSSTAAQPTVKQKEDEPPVLDSALISQLQELTNQLLNADSKPKEEAVKFNKKLLDFDYGDEEEEEDEKEENGHASVEPTALALSMAQNLLSNPELLRQLQQMQQTIQQTEALTKGEGDLQGEPLQSDNTQEENYFNQVVPPEPTIPQQPVYSESPTTYMAPQQVPPIHEVHLPPQMVEPVMCTDMSMDYGMMPDVAPPQMLKPPPQSHLPVSQDVGMLYHDHDERQVWLAHVKDEDERELSRKEKSRSRSRSPRSSGRSTRKHSSSRRSRSRSPRRGRRSRSKSPGRYNRRDKRNSSSHDWEREQERERERERRRKGLPTLKKNLLAVCSTTLWLGHVPKVIAEADISEVFAEYGEVTSIDVIPPRGCAYVCMKHRQDASRALMKLRNLKLQGSNIKMAWAPGKGVKGKEYKDFWDVEQGTTYIPHEKLPEGVALETLEEGGVIDEDSMPPSLKEIRQKKEEERRAKEEAAMLEQQQKTAALLPTAQVPVVPPQMTSQFGMTPVPGVVGTQPIVMPQITMPLGVPPPNTMMMMPPHTTQPLLNTQSLMTPIVAPIQGAMSAALSAAVAVPLQGTPLTGVIPTTVPATVTTSLTGVMASVSATQVQRLGNAETRKGEGGDKTPTEDERPKDDKTGSNQTAIAMDIVISKQPSFVPPGAAIQAPFPANAMNSMPQFPPPGFQPFNRLPIAPHIQPNQGIGGIPQGSPWGNANFPRPQGMGVVPPFPPGQLGVIPGMPHQLAGGIPNRPNLFPSAIPRPSLNPQDFPGVTNPLNITPKIDGLNNISSEGKNESETLARFANRGSVPPGRLSPHANQDSPSRGMAMPGRGVLGGANAIPLPQEMGFRSPRPMNFPPQHGGRGAPFAFGGRQQGPFMMRGMRGGPRPNMDFHGSNPNFMDGPFEPEWGHRRQFGPVDRGDPYFGREEFDDWDDPRLDGPMPVGRERDMLEDKPYGERGWPRDAPFRHEEDDERRFRSRETRFEDRRRGGGFRERERSRFDDFRGDRNGGRDWGRRDRDRSDRSRDRDRERDRSESWGDRDRERDRDSRSSRRDRDKRSTERESEKQKTVEPVSRPEGEVCEVKDSGTLAEVADGGEVLDSDTFSKVPDSGTFSEVPESGTFSEVPDRGAFSDAPDRGAFSDAPDDSTFMEVAVKVDPVQDECPMKVEPLEVYSEPLPEFQPKMELSEVEMEPVSADVTETELPLDRNNVEPVLVENSSS